jgi:hypothetical protein
MSNPANRSPATVKVSEARARTGYSSSDTVVAKLAALFSVLVIAAEIAGPAIGIPRGVLAPTVADFGNPDHLLQLSRNHGAAIVPWSCALAGPYLALVVAIGWYRLLRHAGGVALCAVVLFYATNLLVVLAKLSGCRCSSNCRQPMLPRPQNRWRRFSYSAPL